MVLCAFVPTAQEHHNISAFLAKINPIAGPMIHAQFAHAFTN